VTSSASNSPSRNSSNYSQKRKEQSVESIGKIKKKSKNLLQKKLTTTDKSAESDAANNANAKKRD
jgi:hypothetical protein